MTPLLCLQPPHPKDIIPRRGLITNAKVMKMWCICKFRVKKTAISFFHWKERERDLILVQSKQGCRILLGDKVMNTQKLLLFSGQGKENATYAKNFA